jgi:hypothetical protein
MTNKKNKKKSKNLKSPLTQEKCFSPFKDNWIISLWIKDIKIPLILSFAIYISTLKTKLWWFANQE